MATITVDDFLDGGTARVAGEAFAIGSGARFTVRTDSRIHANAPASFTGSLGNPTFTDIGGEIYIDSSAVREISYTGSTGPAASEIAAAILAAAQITPIWADMRKMNNVLLTGVGQPGNEWVAA